MLPTVVPVSRESALAVLDESNCPPEQAVDLPQRSGTRPVAPFRFVLLERFAKLSEAEMDERAEASVLGLCIEASLPAMAIRTPRH